MFTVFLLCYTLLDDCHPKIYFYIKPILNGIYHLIDYFVEPFVNK